MTQKQNPASRVLTLCALIVLLFSALWLVPAAAVAADLELSSISTKVTGGKTEVTLQFKGKIKPKGKVFASDKGIMVELQGTAKASKLSTAQLKSPLINGYETKADKAGALVLLLLTSGPVDLAGTPVASAGKGKKGSPQLRFVLQGTAAAAPKAVPAALSALESSAKKGDVASQMKLASALAQETPPDFAGALKWYKAAAEKGNGPAAYNVGQYLRMGVGGITPDPKTAMTWYERASTAGFSPAKVNLAIMLLQQDNPTPDTVEHARVLLQQASAAGNAQAQDLLLRMGGPLQLNIR